MRVGTSFRLTLDEALPDEALPTGASLEGSRGPGDEDIDDIFDSDVVFFASPHASLNLGGAGEGGGATEAGI